MSRAPLTAEVTATALDCPTHPATKPVACLPQFHLLLYCNSYFSSVFFVVTFALLLYKKAVLDYAAGVVEGEAALLFLYLPVQGSRYFFGSSAYGFDNAMKRNNYLLVFGLLTLPLLMFHGYWMQNQLGAGAIGASRAERDAFCSLVNRRRRRVNEQLGHIIKAASPVRRKRNTGCCDYNRSQHPLFRRTGEAAHSWQHRQTRSCS